MFVESPDIFLESEINYRLFSIKLFSNGLKMVQILN